MRRPTLRDASEDTSMTKKTKVLAGSAAAAAIAVSSASPAMAQGIDVGDVIAGAVILGGIAAVAGAFDNDDRGRTYGYPYEGRYYDYDYRDGNPRQAAEQGVYAAERRASRRSYGGADVTDIRNIDRTRRGYVVRGRIAVNTLGRGWRSGDRYYGRGWNSDYRGWNQRLRGYDAGTFRCRYEYGRVVD